MMNKPVIEQLRHEREKIRKKIEDLKNSIAKELSAAEADLAHIQGAIEYYERDNAEQQARIPQFIVDNLAREGAEPKLRGLTHKQAVVAIARHNGGIIKSSDAKRLMIRAGIMAETKNASRMVHNAIKHSNMFESISPGEYRLKAAPSTVNVVPNAPTLQ